MRSSYLKAFVWVSFVVFVLGLVGACNLIGGDKGGGNGNSCEVAVAGCECYPNNSCELGYVCGSDGLCAAPGSSGGSGGDSGLGGSAGAGTGCDDSCAYANDNECDDPGFCTAGTDCTDCAATGCNDSCAYANDNECDDPGFCATGTDCTDCAVIGCEAGWENCNGCVNTSSNPLHCGGCNQPCQDGYVCEAGQCKDGGDCTVNPCAGFAYCDLLTKRCRPGCGSDNQCALNEVCDLVQHTCSCSTGFHSCSNVCSANDGLNSCGAACSPCLSPQNGVATCDGTNCGIQCNQGFIQCGNGCYPDTGGGESVQACGPNCTPCPVPANSTATCFGGSCGSYCNEGYNECGGNCYSLAALQTFCAGACAPCAQRPGMTVTCNGNNQCEYRCVDTSMNERCGRCVTLGGGDPCNSDQDCCSESSFHQACIDGACQHPYRSCGPNFDCPPGMICQGDSSPGYCTIDCTDVSQCPDYLPLLYPDYEPNCFEYCYMPCINGNCPAGFSCVNFVCEW